MLGVELTRRGRTRPESWIRQDVFASDEPLWEKLEKQLDYDKVLQELQWEKKTVEWLAADAHHASLHGRPDLRAQLQGYSRARSRQHGPTPARQLQVLAGKIEATLNSALERRGVVKALHDFEIKRKALENITADLNELKDQQHEHDDRHHQDINNGIHAELMQDRASNAQHIDDGTILACIDDEEGAAEVFRSAHSHSVIGTVPCGNGVEASGKPIEVGGYIMVPIKPFGAVQLDHFDIHENTLKDHTLAMQQMAELIDDGTILTCLNDEEGPAEVFQSLHSHVVIGEVPCGNGVEASGEAIEVDGYIMVPIKPNGAVQLDHFAILDDAKNHRRASRPGDTALQTTETKIHDGTMLTCLDDHEGPAEVFRSTRSHSVIGEVPCGYTVEASGNAIEVDGYVMVPIKPQGAVQLDHFAVLAGETAVKATAQQIDVGTKLMCLDDEEGPAEVFRSTRSHSVIGEVPSGYVVEASGQAVEEGGYIMVPIKPQGAVQLDHFAFFADEAAVQELAEHIDDGTLLTCLEDDEGAAEVFRSAHSHSIIGEVPCGSRVEASGKVEEEGGYLMVPIKPKGAVQLDHFAIFKLRRSLDEGAKAHQAAAQAMANQIDDGTMLTCLDDGEGPSEIFGSLESHSVIGVVPCGGRVEASGKATDVDGYIMVPIKPEGAVQLDHFALFANGWTDSQWERSLEARLGLQASPEQLARRHPSCVDVALVEELEDRVGLSAAAFRGARRLERRLHISPMGDEEIRSAYMESSSHERIEHELVERLGLSDASLKSRVIIAAKALAEVKEVLPSRVDLERALEERLGLSNTYLR